MSRFGERQLRDAELAEVASYVRALDRTGPTPELRIRSSGPFPKGRSAG